MKNKNWHIYTYYEYQWKIFRLKSLIYIKLFILLCSNLVAFLFILV